MSITQYKIKRSDGNYYDISGVFSTKTSSAITVASSNPYKYSTTTNILNNFEVYSSTGDGHPLQTSVTGYKINNIDISYYYTPYYSFISGIITPTSITIPNWASKVSFIIQAAGGSKGSNSTGSRTLLYNVTKRANVSNTAYFRNGNQIYPTANQSFTYYSNYASMSINVYKGRLYQKGTTYTGGNGSGGTCYAGTYTINNTNRPSGMTYINNNGLTSYLQFNDITNNSTVTVPNGTTGGNATSSQNGLFGGSSLTSTFVNSSYFSGNSYITSTTNSGYSTLTPTQKNSYPLPTSASTSFTVQGNSAQPAFFIYWFLI